MKKLPQNARRRAALLLAAGLWAVLPGCAESPAPTQHSESLPAAQASPAPTPDFGTQETAAASFPYRASAEAAQRAAEFWESEMTGDPVASLCAVYETVCTSALNYEDCVGDEDLQALLSFGTSADGRTPLAQIFSGDAILIQVHFYLEYQPKANFLGMQYPDGLNAVYILVPADAEQPCKAVSGWQNSSSSSIPRPIEEADALGLTVYQYRMLTHQCQALAAAGLRDFAAPQDWPQETLFRYLAFRAEDFAIPASEWQTESPAHYANMFLTLDFTAADDWTRNTRFFEETWSGFSEEEIARYSAGLAEGAPSDGGGADALWQFTRTDGQITAQLALPDGRISQRYTFAVYEGFDPSAAWSGRTYCTGGQSF